MGRILQHVRAIYYKSSFVSKEECGTTDIFILAGGCTQFGPAMLVCLSILNLKSKPAWLEQLLRSHLSEP